MTTDDFNLEKWGFSFEKNEYVLSVTALPSAKHRSKAFLMIGILTIIGLSSFTSTAGPIIILFLIMVGLLLVFRLITFLFPSKYDSPLVSFVIDKNQSLCIITRASKRTGVTKEEISFSALKSFVIDDSHIFTDANPFSNGNKLHIKKLSIQTLKNKVPLFSFSSANKDALGFVSVLKHEFEVFAT